MGWEMPLRRFASRSKAYQMGSPFVQFSIRRAADKLIRSTLWVALSTSGTLLVVKLGFWLFFSLQFTAVHRA
jgi:hypothetical protein